LADPLRLFAGVGTAPQLVDDLRPSCAKQCNRRLRISAAG